MSIALTKMLPLIRQWEEERVDVNEILMSQYGAWALGLRHTKSKKSILSPGNKLNAENSYGNTVKIPVFQAAGVTIGTTRSCTIADYENTTALVQLTFNPLQWGLSMYVDQYVTGTQPLNYVGFDPDFNFKVEEINLQLMAQQDTFVRNAIDLAANTYWPPNIATSYYPVVANALQITQGDKDDAFNQLTAIMSELDFYGKMDVLGSTKLTTLTRRLNAQGKENAVNEAFQFMLGAFAFTSSNRVTSATGVSMTGYCIRDGSVAIYNANNPSAKAGRTIGPGEFPVTQWDTMEWPWLGLTVGSYLANTCANNTGGGSTDTATLRTQYSWDTQFGVLLPPPNTLHSQSPFVKFEISAT